MASEDDGGLLGELRAEIERLSRELDLASTEKIQSAQYGLALLEEKSSLQARCNELEALYENSKHELDISQEVSFSVMIIPGGQLALALDAPAVR